jgi:hypothetical protein
MRNLLLLAPLALALAGCKGFENTVVVSTGTVLGVKVGENPTTQLYEAQLGYARVETAWVPQQTNGNTADVVAEVKFNGFPGSGFHQRLAIGKTACSSQGSAMMFARDYTGKLPQANVMSQFLPSPTNHVK